MSLLFGGYTEEWSRVMASGDATSCAMLARLAEKVVSLGEGVAVKTEDYLALWAAAKQANIEWQTSCMIRGVRRYIAADDLIDAPLLALPMLCWACISTGESALFFSTCTTQINIAISFACRRCAAVLLPDGTEMQQSLSEEALIFIHREAALRVAFYLFGWHPQLMGVLPGLSTSSTRLTDEESIFAVLHLIAELLTPSAGPNPRRRGSSTTAAGDPTPTDASIGLPGVLCIPPLQSTAVAPSGPVSTNTKTSVSRTSKLPDETSKPLPSQHAVQKSSDPSFHPSPAATPVENCAPARLPSRHHKKAAQPGGRGVFVGNQSAKRSTSLPRPSSAPLKSGKLAARQSPHSMDASHLGRTNGGEEARTPNDHRNQGCVAF